MNCLRCNKVFDNEAARMGYCPECRDHFKGVRKRVHAIQQPGPGLLLDGKFAETKDCPVTFQDNEDERCGLCGSTKLSSGYGLGSGYGMGCYTWCNDCGSFLNFMEDAE